MKFGADTAENEANNLPNFLPESKGQTQAPWRAVRRVAQHPIPPPEPLHIAGPTQSTLSSHTLNIEKEAGFRIVLKTEAAQPSVIVIPAPSLLKFTDVRTAKFCNIRRSGMRSENHEMQPGPKTRRGKERNKRPTREVDTLGQI